MKLRIILVLMLSNNLIISIDELLAKSMQALKNKEPELALRFLNQAEIEKPNDFALLLQLATTYYLLHQYNQATSYYEKVLAMNPGNINTRYNCATAYCKTGKFNEAQEQYEEAFKRCPDDAIKGALFKIYIRRKQWEKAEQLSPSSLWWYDENIMGKTILLEVDKPGNGFGDSFQFMRYAQILSQAGATIIVKADKALIPLLSLAPYISQVISKDDFIPIYDHSFSICIASLLMTMKHRSISHSQATYLWADQSLITYWKERISQNSALKVGLCWLTNFVQERYSGKITTSPRSVPLESLALLSFVPSINFYSLQKTDVPIKAPFPLHQFVPDFDEAHGRFMDTAALIMNMDLIITVDTSVAHLAAALGKPVWIMLPCESDYRWGLDDTTVPFYPNVRLFRQKEYGKWDDVINEIIDALQEPLATKL